MTRPDPSTAIVDVSLSALLLVQALTLFVAIPLQASYPQAYLLLDACHLTFALICIAVLTTHRLLQALLFGSLLLLAATSAFGRHIFLDLGLDKTDEHEVIALTAFVFNGIVTAIVARHVFGPVRVTVHRVRGAVLIYLNLAALFSIAYAAILSRVPQAILLANGGILPSGAGQQTAALTYFSLATLTTTGYGDLTPISPIARSLANMESVIGQLFPATLLARIVALHLAHGSNDAD